MVRFAFGTVSNYVVKFAHFSSFSPVRQWNRCLGSTLPAVLELQQSPKNFISRSITTTIVRHQKMGEETMKISKDGIQSSSSNSNSSSISSRQRFKLAVKEYGKVLVVFHVTISLLSLAFFYSIVRIGIDPVRLFSFLPYIGESLAHVQFAPDAGLFVVAYAIHKVFAPIRIGITLTSVPVIVRYFNLVASKTKMR